jgi:universal stress protein E
MKTLRRLLMATDLSPASRAGFRAAVALAARSGAKLWIVHALPTFPSPPPAARIYREMDAFLASAAERSLERLARDARGRGAAARPLLLRGRPQDAVRRAAREHRAELVVLGSHARTGLAPLFVGSVAARILTESPCPVLSVAKGRPSAAVRRVVFATDFSPASRAAGRYALALARRNGARLTIVHALTPLAEGQAARWAYAELETEQRAGAQSRLDRLAARARSSGVAADTLLLEGRPDRAIARAVRSMRDAWVVAGTHGRTGLPRALLGSVAARLVATSPRPVITVRGGRSARAASAARR